MSRTNDVMTAAGVMTTFWSMLTKCLQDVQPDTWADRLYALGREQDPETKVLIKRICSVILNIKIGEEKITDRQRRAIELMIATSPDATPEAKKAIIWLLRKTNNLSQNVRANFTSEEEGKVIANCVHAMLSSNARTHLGERLVLLGVKLFIAQSQDFRGSTIYISTDERYDHDALSIPVNMDDIQAVNLEHEAIRGKDFYAIH